MARTDRTAQSIRPLRFERAYTEQAAGSVLAIAGRTKVLCTVCVQESVPQWLNGQGKAWLSAEYSMLPAATRTRKLRDGRLGRIDARSLEIQRLIGRALRAVVDLRALPEITLWVDCDVLEADGGTRTTAINGACLALHDALLSLQDAGRLARWPMHGLVSAISIGRIQNEFLVDLDYKEDSAADLDLNVVRLGDDRLVEVQGSAERGTYTDEELNAMLTLSRDACRQVATAQQLALETR